MLKNLAFAAPAGSQRHGSQRPGAVRAVSTANGSTGRHGRHQEKNAAVTKPPRRCSVLGGVGVRQLQFPRVFFQCHLSSFKIGNQQLSADCRHHRLSIGPLHLAFHLWVQPWVRGPVAETRNAFLQSAFPSCSRRRAITTTVAVCTCRSLPPGGGLGCSGTCSTSGAGRWVLGRQTTGTSPRSDSAPMICGGFSIRTLTPSSSAKLSAGSLRRSRPPNAPLVSAPSYSTRTTRPTGRTPSTRHSSSALSRPMPTRCSAAGRSPKSLARS